jgi:hypothetical protein
MSDVLKSSIGAIKPDVHAAGLLQVQVRSWARMQNLAFHHLAPVASCAHRADPSCTLLLVTASIAVASALNMPADPRRPRMHQTLPAKTCRLACHPR